MWGRGGGANSPCRTESVNFMDGVADSTLRGITKKPAGVLSFGVLWFSARRRIRQFQKMCLVVQLGEEEGCCCSLWVDTRADAECPAMPRKTLQQSCLAHKANGGGERAIPIIMCTSYSNARFSNYLYSCIFFICFNQNKETGVRLQLPSK